MKNEVNFSLLSAVLFLSFAMIGCSHTARLFPVQGPLSAQTPSPVLVGKITGAFNSGSLSFVLGDGEVCSGHWTMVPRAKGTEVAKADGAPNGMSSEWDIVYGSGFYVSHVLGTRLYVRAVVSGNKGTVLNVELYRPENAEGNIAAAVKGVAKDNRGNIYKLVL